MYVCFEVWENRQKQNMWYMYVGEICEYKTAVMKEVTDHNYSLLKT